MICASTTWLVESNAFEMKVASRTFNLRKVLLRIRKGHNPDKAANRNSIRLSKDMLTNVATQAMYGTLPARRSFTIRGLPVCRTTNVKGFGFPKPFLMETLLLDLAFDDLEARIGIQFELIA